MGSSGKRWAIYEREAQVGRSREMPLNGELACNEEGDMTIQRRERGKKVQ